MTRIRIAAKTLKWMAFAIVILMFISGLISKIFHYLHLKSVEFNTISISPVSVILGIVASAFMLVLASIERAIYNHPFNHPEQIIIIAGGISGIIYNIFLGLLLIKNII